MDRVGPTWAPWGLPQLSVEVLVEESRQGGGLCLHLLMGPQCPMQHCELPQAGTAMVFTHANAVKRLASTPSCGVSFGEEAHCTLFCQGAAVFPQGAMGHLHV